MSWHFLQEGEAVSWEGNSLDGAPFALLKLTPTPEKSSSPVSETESLNPSPSGTTLQPSTELHGEEPLTSLVEDSPAKILVQPGRAQESEGSKAGCGWKWRGSFVKYDPDTSSWRTRQCSLVEGLDVFSETWPRWGMMRNGECLERITLERPTSGIGFGLWPTPRVGMARGGHQTYSRGRSNLEEEVGASVPGGGTLNPTWVEWLMGWPIGWTDLRPLEMGKFRQWLNSHGRV